MFKLKSLLRYIKYMLYFINVIFLLCGLLLIAAGAGVIIKYGYFELYFGSIYFKPAHVVMACGSILIVLSLLGFYGAAKQNVAMIIMYAFFLLLLVVVELGAVFVVLGMNFKIYTNIEANMQNSLRDYNTVEHIKNAWDFTQEKLHCCGVHDPQDWENEEVDGFRIKMNDSYFTVPDSCYQDNWNSCHRVYSIGCLNLLETYAHDSILAIINMGVIVNALQALSVGFAYILARSIWYIKLGLAMEQEEDLQTLNGEKPKQRNATPPFFISLLCPEPTDA